MIYRGGPASLIARGDLEFQSGEFLAGTYEGSASFTRYSAPGRHILDAEFAIPEVNGDTEYGRLVSSEFYVKRNTMMPAFNASPEPVRKGSPIKVAGRLTKLWPDVGYVGYGGKTIEVYFKPVGGTWTLKGTATTDSNGCWSRSFTASEDGIWQARFKGTSNYHRETSHRDYVDVQ